MDPIRKIPKKFTKKFVNKVINRQYFRERLGFSCTKQKLTGLKTVGLLGL